MAVVGTVLGVCSLFGPIGWAVGCFVGSSNPPCLNINNANGSLTTDAPVMLAKSYASLASKNNMASSNLESFIYGAIQKDPATLVPNGKPYDVDTDGVFSHDLALKDSMVLDDQVVSLLEASNCSKACLEYLYTRVGIDKEAKDEKGSTQLMYAVTYGRQPEIQYLVDLGANVNARDEFGNTALHFLVMRLLQAQQQGIASKGTIDIIHAIKYLIKYGADPCIENKNGDSPRSIAAYLYKEFDSMIIAIFDGAKQCA